MVSKAKQHTLTSYSSLSDKDKEYIRAISNTSNNKEEANNIGKSKTVKLKVVLPEGYPKDAKIMVWSNTHQEFDVDENGYATINYTPAMQSIYIDADWNGRSDTMFKLLTKNPPDNLEATIQRTAIEESLTIAFDFRYFPPDESQKLIEEIGCLKEVQALEQLIASNIVSNPHYISSNDKEYLEAYKQAMAVVTKLLNERVLALKEILKKEGLY